MLRSDGDNRISLDPDRVVVLLGSTVGVLILGHTFAVYIYRGLGTDAFPGAAAVARLLNMDGETNVPSWFSVGMLLAAAALAGIIAASTWRAEPEPGQRRWSRHWAALAAILAFLSLDEGALIHEELSRPLTSRFDLDPERWEFWAWLVPYTLLGLLVLVVFLGFLRALPRSTRLHFLVAGAVFVAGAAGMELVGRELWNPHDIDATYLAGVGVEEVLEMTGVIILLRGLLAHLRDHVGRVELSWGTRAVSSTR